MCGDARIEAKRIIRAYGSEIFLAESLFKSRLLRKNPRHPRSILFSVSFRAGTRHSLPGLSDMVILGFDIGGANLKAATNTGRACSRPFAMWRHPERLAAALCDLAGDFPPADLWVATMTGELADCFATKGEGVRQITGALAEAAAGRETRIWQTNGCWGTPAEILAAPTGAAAANWHALATWVGTWVSDDAALLMDIGTTTTDLIPLVQGRPQTWGSTDPTRLLAGELVYTGVRRTPVCAVTPAVPWGGGRCPLAAELFATTLDVYLLLGDVAADERDTETANNQPATVAAAHDRLARALCCDRSECDRAAAVEIARFVAQAQQQQIARAIEQVVARLPGRCTTVVICGSGSFLAQRVAASHPALAGARLKALGDRLSPGLSDAACAYALTQLAANIVTFGGC